MTGLLSPRQAFVDVLRRDGNIDLAEAALLIAQSEYPLMEVSSYLRRLDLLADRVKRGLALVGSRQRLEEVVNHVLFTQEKFRGNDEDYFDPRNSLLNAVIDRRKGIPITLSLLYMEVARRAGLRVEGVGLPGHFIVRLDPDDEPPFLVDPFHQGRRLSRSECEERVERLFKGRVPFDASFLRPVTGEAILTRLLTNLKSIYLDSGAFAKAYGVIDRLVILSPLNWTEVRDRGLVSLRLKRPRSARTDLADYLANTPHAGDRDEIHRLVQDIDDASRSEAGGLS
jgi:regulator of sirC expression with transglutaminase-like and TPR domain